MNPKFKPMDGEIADLLNKTFTGHWRRGYMKVDGFVLADYYEKFADAIENFEVHDDDVWVTSFPKTGTTWTQEMVRSIANDLDPEQTKIPLVEKFPFLEMSPLFYPDETVQRSPDFMVPESVKDSVSFVDKLPRPRFIKTHLPFNLLPRQIRTREKNPKIIYVTRNAKDTCISYYHHCMFLEGFQGNFDDFVNLFLGDALCYTPFWTHILSYSKQRIHDNVLFIKYEDMKRDLPSVIRKTATFLGKNLTSDQVSALNEHLSLQSMKKNSAVNNEHLVKFVQELTLVQRDGAFLRNGTTGQWQTDMTPEQIQRFDHRTRENFKNNNLS